MGSNSSCNEPIQEKNTIHVIDFKLLIPLKNISPNSKSKFKLMNSTYLRMIFDCLSVKDTVIISRTCKYFYFVAAPDILWSDHLFSNVEKQCNSYEKTKQKLAEYTDDISIIEKYASTNNLNNYFTPLNLPKNYSINRLVIRTTDICIISKTISDTYFKYLLDKYSGLTFTVQNLIVSGSKFSHSDFNKACENIKSLKYINISSCDRDNIKIINNNLTRLNLGNYHNLFGQGMLYLKDINAPNLQNLDITGLGIVGEFIKSISIRYKKLDTLILKNVASESIDKIGKEIKSITNLKHLDISNTKSKGLCLLSLHDSQIESLNLSHIQISPIVWTILANMPKLRYLDITNCVLLDENDQTINYEKIEPIYSPEYNGFVTFIRDSKLTTLKYGGTYVCDFFEQCVKSHPTINNNKNKFIYQPFS
jgi:hypothetical protein